MRGYGIDPKKPKEGEKEMSVGSGVVILENRTILTNLHVVIGAKRFTVTFSDGMESDAVLVAAREAIPRDRAMVAGTGSNSTLLTIRQTQRAAEIGADAVLVVTPYYNKPPAEGIRRHVAAIADVGVPVPSMP